MPRILFIGGGSSKYPCQLLKTGQTTQYDSELDDGYYQAGIAKKYTINTTGAQSGTTNVDLAHLINTGISFDATSKEIRCTGQCGVFKAGGGESIVVSGSASNNGIFTTVSATADKVVVSQSVADESAGASITIAKREAISNNTVLDTKTGLEWMRYRPVKFGASGIGYMRYTGVPYSIFQCVAAMNAANLGGHNDWRVPNIFELFSIQDFEAPLGYPDSTAFPSAASDLASSSTVVATIANYYDMNNAYGTVRSNGVKASGTSCLRVVRGGL